MVKIMLSEEEISILRKNSSWQEEQNQYYLPNFCFKEQKVN
jgi:hypothetical protein